MSQTQKPEPPDALKSNTVEARILKQKIWDRMWLNDEHFMGVLVGREGSGKSWTGIKMAEVCDPTFEGWRVMFDPADFLEQLQEWKEENKTKGKMVVIDEAGVGVGVRSWYEKDQILLNQVLQLIRSENMGVIFTLPRLEELDSQTEGRLHAFMQMTDIDRGSWAKLKWFNWDPTRDGRGEMYREYPELRVNGHPRKIERLKLSPPSSEIIEPYEERKDAFQAEQYQRALDEMEDDVDDEMTVKEVAMEIADGKPEQFVSRHGQTKEPYINKQLIRAEYELSHSDSQAVKSLLERQFTETDLEEYA